MLFASLVILRRLVLPPHGPIYQGIDIDIHALLLDSAGAEGGEELEAGDCNERETNAQVCYLTLSQCRSRSLRIKEFIIMPSTVLSGIVSFPST